MALAEFEAADSEARAKKNVTQAIERVSARLGNTPTICRKCYVHPEIVSAYLGGGLLLEVQKDIDAQLRDGLETLRPEEAAVLSFLRTRVARDLAAAESRPGPDCNPPASSTGRRASHAARRPRPKHRQLTPHTFAPLDAVGADRAVAGGGAQHTKKD
jgi:DNA topoisomerase-1